MDIQQQMLQIQQPRQINNEQPSFTFSSILSALFYLLTISAVIYYLWTWWRNTNRLKQSLAALNHKGRQKHSKEGFADIDDGDTLLLEKPAATQAKVACPDSPYKLSKAISVSLATVGVWDAEEDGHILFEEPARRWTDTRLGSNTYSPAVNQALEELKTKYKELITTKTGQMIDELNNADLKNYLLVFTDLEKLVSSNSQIAQLKGMMLAQTELLGRIRNSLSELLLITTDSDSAYSQKWRTKDTGDTDGRNDYSPIWEQSEMTKEELGRQIIRNRQMRKLLEQRLDDGALSVSTANIDLYKYIQSSPKVLTELINICDKLIIAYKALLPLIDEVISLRAKYEKENQEILNLVEVLPEQSDAQNQASADNANVQSGGRGQIPNGVIGSGQRSPTADRWPQRYYLNKQSSHNFKITKDLDMLRTKIKDPQGFSKEEYDAKYNWIDRIGKDVLPVEGDPEIKYALPAGMQRTIPDIISDFDHNNANCQRIYGECSTRADVPGFPLPNWDTADYYKYLDRLPDAKQATEGVTPSIF